MISMKLIKIFVMGVIMTLISGATLAQGFDDAFEKTYAKCVQYQGTEWNVMPFSPDHSERVCMLRCTNTYNGSYAKIIAGADENTTIIFLSDVDCEYVTSAKLKIGTETYPLRKISKGQTKADDTFFSRYLSKPNGLLWGLIYGNATKGTLLQINCDYLSLFKKNTSISLEMPFKGGKYTFEFAPSTTLK